MNEGRFKKILNNKFDFLRTEYDFELLTTIDDPDFYKIVLKNTTTGVAIIYEYRDANILIYLYKLIDGKIVEDRSPIVESKPLNSIELGYIVQYKDAEKISQPLYDTMTISFDNLVDDLSRNLKDFAEDVLKGDFSIFTELDLIAKKRRLEWQNK